MFKSKTQPLCRYCGALIKKHGESVYVYAEPPRDQYVEEIQGFVGGRMVKTGERIQKIHVPRHVVGQPKTKSECQSLADRSFNHPVSVISISRSGEGIRRFNIWDGETYVDEFFCNGEHARRFGYETARTGMAMPAYNRAVKNREGKGHG